MTEELASALASALGGDVRVEGLRSLSGGASRETWSFDALGADGAPRPLILQIDRAVPGPGRVSLGVQAELLRAAERAGVPVPAVVAGGRDPDGPLGREFVVMERLEGETIPQRILRDDAFARARGALASQCGTALGRIHAIPMGEVHGLEHQDPVVVYRKLLDDLGQPHAAFELGFRWLEPRRPPPARETVVHGDFRNGNFIVGPDGMRAVIDWELAHTGDPMEDLGWVCVRSWRFGHPAPVGGFGTREDLFAAYERESGLPVDSEVVRWWEVVGTVKWGIICIVQAMKHLSGAERSVELAAIGRRSCEVEHDLLLLLEDDRSSAPSARVP